MGRGADARAKRGFSLHRSIAGSGRLLFRRPIDFNALAGASRLPPLQPIAQQARNQSGGCCAPVVPSPVAPHPPLTIEFPAAASFRPRGEERP